MKKIEFRTPNPMIPVPPDEDCGEAMKTCNPRERAFVVHYVMTGGRNQTESALQAGYCSPDKNNAAAVTAMRLLRRPRILAALREEAEKAMKTCVILATEVLREIAMDPSHRDRFKAAVELLNRSGLLVETQHRVTVQDDRRSVEEIRAEIVEVFKRVFADRPVPPELAEPIDVEFVSIPDSSRAGTNGIKNTQPVESVPEKEEWDEGLD